MDPTTLLPTEPDISTERELLWNLWTLHARLQSELHHVLRPHRITWRQMVVLQILQRCGDESGVPIGELVRQYPSRVPDLTRTVDRLEQAGRLTRAPHERDRRIRLIRLTDAGRRLLDQLARTLGDAYAQQFAPLSAAERRALDALVTKLIRTEPTTSSVPDAPAAARPTPPGEPSGSSAPNQPGASGTSFPAATSFP